MPFRIRDVGELEFMREQADLSDRLVGLIYPILIDERLRELIEKNWKDDRKGELLETLLRDGGPLGALDTRIKVGFAIGMYDERILDDLKMIAKIRNKFAHKKEARDFDTPPVSNFVNELKLPDHYPKKEVPSDAVFQTMDAWTQAMLCHSGLKDLTPRRTKFLRAVEIILTWLTICAGDIQPLVLPPSGRFAEPST